MKFNIFTMVWGDHHVDLFERACFRSLCWPKNKAVLNGAIWRVYTDPDHFEKIKSIFAGSSFTLDLVPIPKTIMIAGVGMAPSKQVDAGVVLLNGLKEAILYGIQNQSKVLFAPPDTIFGDGTIPNLLSIGSGPGVCVSVAHPRVLPRLVDEIEYIGSTRGAVSNPALVTMAFNFGHDSWKLANVDHEKNNSFVGGIAWRKIDDGLYTVTHRLPTVYLADFTSIDWDFFWSQVSFGGWDHRWPAENLIRQERQRLVGSSDACFIVEVTDHDKNVPPDLNEDAKKQLNYIRQTGELDRYWNHHYHNGINRQTTVIFRGE